MRQYEKLYTELRYVPTNFSVESDSVNRIHFFALLPCTSSNQFLKKGFILPALFPYLYSWKKHRSVR